MTHVVEWIIVLPLLVFLIFGHVDQSIMNTQFNQAEHIKNQYTDVARLKGCLEEEDKENIIKRLENLGFEEVQIEVVDGRDNSIVYDEDNRAIRKISDSYSDIPEININIRGQFKNNRLWLSKAINKDREDLEKIPFSLQGITYTEYIERD